MLKKKFERILLSMHWGSEIHNWWVYKWNIRVDCNDRHSSDSDRSTFNIETENITSNLNLNNSVKNWFILQFVQKVYVLYEIDWWSIFINTFKNIVSKIDVCSVLNIKENECIERQKVNIEMFQHIAKCKKTKKSKRSRDEEYTPKKWKVVNNTPPPQMNRMEKINRTLTFHDKRLCKIVFPGRHFVRNLWICYRILCQTLTGYAWFYSAQFGGKKRSSRINKWLSYSRLQCFAVVILTAILEFVIGFCDKFLQIISSFISYNSVEKRRLCINKWLSYSWL